MRSSDLDRIAALLSREHKIRIVPSDDWRSDEATKTVYYNKVDVFKLSEDHVLGLLMHEIGHIKHTSKIPAAKLGQHPELREEILNVLEDIRIEERMSRAYRNSREIIEMTRNESHDLLVRILHEHQASLHEKALLYAGARFYGRGFAVPVNDYEILGEHVASLMKDKKNEIFDAPTTAALNPIAEEIEKLLISEGGQPTPQQKRNMQQRMQQRQTAALYGSKYGPGMDPIKRKIIEEMAKAAGKNASKLIKHYQSAEIGPVVEILEQSALIGKQLHGVLKRNNSREYGGRYRTGKLMAKRIYKTRASRDFKPFARAIVKSNKSYAFAIMSDVSGSMFGGRGTNNAASVATSSMLMAAEALRIAKVPRASFLFGNHLVPVGKMSSNTHHTYDDIEQTFHRGGGGTETGKCLLEMLKELAPVDAERKIAIFFTDGQDNAETVRPALKFAEKHGIEIIGMFYGPYESPVAEVLAKGNAYHLRNKEEIPAAFIKSLKRTIKVSS